MIIYPVKLSCALSYHKDNMKAKKKGWVCAVVDKTTTFHDEYYSFTNLHNF